MVRRVDSPDWNKQPNANEMAQAKTEEDEMIQKVRISLYNVIHIVFVQYFFVLCAVMTISSVLFILLVLAFGCITPRAVGESQAETQACSCKSET